MRKLLVATAVTVLAGVAAASAHAATRTVRIGDFYFVRDGRPPTITVDRGTRLRFKWVGTQLHNVRVVSGPRRFKSKLKATGRFTRTLRKAGTYKLVCEPHESIMKLTVRVR